jgi:4-alpha-glucanotransferase
MSAIKELAAHCGIEDSFQDARGERRDTSDQTRQALLAAMGLKVEDEAGGQALLTAFRARLWQRSVPPVVVADRRAGPPVIEVTLPAATHQISWRFIGEDGSETKGEAHFPSLPMVDAQEGRERRKLILPEAILDGYHRLSIEPGGGETVLIVSPGKCWLPPVIEEGRKIWGVAAQLYLLRSSQDWGIGDFGDLRIFVKMLAERGADVIGLNPLHAMFLDDPERASPYSPATRLLLNVLNIDVAGLPELTGCEEAKALIAREAFQQALQQCRAARLVDYTGVTSLKTQVLRSLFAYCLGNQSSAHWQAFAAFRGQHGRTLELGCLFQALRQHFSEEDADQADWHVWPDAYRDPRSAEVAAFATDRAELVTFYMWLQFLADTQLGAAAKAASGMAVGLYRDLAVGADPSGAETWANQSAVAGGAQVGAPPDIYNPAGQDWGLPPFNPRALQDEAYASFIDLVRANMRHAGGLRIDHVMALQHLYWVPKGASPAQGAYVGYPLKDLVAILALESHRHQCLVVGEDLGTVPEGFREAMQDANILSYRVLFFEKTGEGFLRPDQYPSLALAVVGSHDLPTLRGWWEGSDILLRESLGLYPKPENVQQARAERDSDRRQLFEALKSAKLVSDVPDIETLIEAAHSYLARSNSVLAMAQIDDICNEAEPVNVPSTSTEHPNWRRRLSLSLEELAHHPRFLALAEIFEKERKAR